MSGLRFVPSYPLPTTCLNPKCDKGGKMLGKPGDRSKVAKTTPMMTPGPTRYNAGEAKLRATLPAVKSGSWKGKNPREAKHGAMVIKTSTNEKVGPGSYEDSYTKGVMQSGRPKWSVPKGKGIQVARLRTCGADAFYNVKKEYVDCAVVGGVDGGLLVQGGVQVGGGSRIKKTHKMIHPDKRTKSLIPTGKDPRKPPAPGPGHYPEAAAQVDKNVLPRAPNYSSSKTPLDKSRFPGYVARGKMWVPPPGAYKGDEVVKKNKVNKGAELEQALGHASSFDVGAS